MRTRGRSGQYSIILILSFLLSILFSGLSLSAQAEGSYSEVYRLYNSNSGEHFYTFSTTERDYLSEKGWTYEGIAWNAPSSSQTPVYRIYNPYTGEHLYTTSASERDALIGAEWSYEGVGWYSDDNQGTPLYRLYNPYASGQFVAGAHHYTKDTGERDILISKGWQYEGIGWYGSVTESIGFDISKVPAYSGNPVYIVNNNNPFFETNELTSQSFENYSELDALGRCGVAYACIDQSMMPTEERGEIGFVRPSGWHTVKYDCIPDRYLYNRCHLIGYQFTGQNALPENLITGTRYLNVTGMLPYENNLSAYIRSGNNHVLYRVTPIFEGNNLVSSGVLMEAYSVEDKGKLHFCVFCYNVQPGVIIDYSTGKSVEDPNYVVPSDNAEEDTGDNNNTDKTVIIPKGTTYVLNVNTHKFHRCDCSSVTAMSERNRGFSDKTREELINEGYTPCRVCKP